MNKIYDFEQGGWSPDSINVIAMGRNTGKSMFSAAMMKQWLDAINAPVPISALEFDTGTVYGARYYTVKPEGGVWADLQQWCEESFGPHGGAIWGNDPNKPPFPNERWYMNNSKFWFRNEKDRDWFAIRWSTS
jgi:hypothetical protein